MNKLHLLFLSVVLFSVNSFSQKQKGKFEIIGNVTGFADSTLLYLKDISVDGSFGLNTPSLDSAFITHNQFRFKGSLKSQPLSVVLMTSDPDYESKKFWLENSIMVFNAEKDKFKEAIIVGSKTQREQDSLYESLKKIQGKDQELISAFIRKHPNSIVSANALNIMCSTWGKHSSTILYNSLSLKMKNTLYGKNVLEYIKLKKNPKVGDLCVDFVQPNIMGENIRLSSYRDKVVLLDFWGSWCGSCRANNPDLKKIYLEYKSKGFDVLGVATERRMKDLEEAVRQDGLPWQNVTDLNGRNNKVARIYGVDKYPTSFLIDKNGKIVAMDLSGDALRNKLREMLD